MPEFMKFENSARLIQRGLLCKEDWDPETIMFSFPETFSVVKALLLLSPTRRRLLW